VSSTRFAVFRYTRCISVSIIQAAPISGISNINREQAELILALNLRKPVPDTQLPLL